MSGSNFILDPCGSEKVRNVKKAFLVCIMLSPPPSPMEIVRYLYIFVLSEKILNYAQVVTQALI
jgi:hypothetical protein